MPELAELRMTADVINAVSENREFYNIQKNGQHKCPDLETPFKKFTISAESKGKELQLTLKDVKFPIVKKLMMGMGMTGGFMSIEKGEEIPKKFVCILNLMTCCFVLLTNVNLEIGSGVIGTRIEVQTQQKNS